MASTNPPVTKNDENWLGEDGNKLPSTLNVLTILTFICNGLGAVFSLLGFFRAQANYDNLVKNQDKLDQVPSFMKGFMGEHPVETARIALENRVPVLLITLIGCFLCFYGALQMRKLKKAGFGLYILGDIVPFATYIFIGTSAITAITFILGIAIVAVFAILYATQLKYMK
jgi:hypothetical protein